MATIIIPLADFSDNAIENVNANKMDFISSCVPPSPKLIRYLNISGSSAVLACYSNSALGRESLFVFDVSAFVGHTIAIKAAHPVAAGVEFCCFADNADMEAIEAYYETAKTNTAAVGPQLTGKISAIENFNVSAQSNVENTITKVIPATAKYLFITNDVNIVSVDNLSAILTD